ncbi:uncharacterized protein CCOS01_01742 [Colletotrichum costaricense]|uniref:Uncharacterized protein n=1 Tax=Colletotrichum costaricense TaxID=1209916 RepID=A0AAJ0E4S4_9PEZI|nr:uncharacterized protein CCOS01_01742 [Colletotrichum costaricense]KAK1536422.1 hypothetical protein CCOS01_01742 [Colletotrichum costaricense]
MSRGAAAAFIVVFPSCSPAAPNGQGHPSDASLPSGNQPVSVPFKSSIRDDFAVCRVVLGGTGQHWMQGEPRGFWFPPVSFSDSI